jgi:hypothetical protein
MPVTLTGSTIATTYGQILHIDGGPEATEKVVYSGTGVATALKVGVGSVSVENIQFNENTITTLNTNGNLILSPNGTGSVVISKASFSDPSQTRINLGLGTIATQNANDVAITGGAISGVSLSGTFTGLTSISATTLTGTTTNGGNLRLASNTLSSTDTNGDITLAPNGTGRVVTSVLSATSPRIITGINDTNGNELVKVTAVADAVNEITVANAPTASGPVISTTGSDTDIDLNLTPKGAGEVNVTNIDVISGKVPFNTITNRAYASFYDAGTTDQTGSATDRTAVKWATAAVAGLGVTVASNSRITVAAAGTYRFNISLQFSNAENTDHDVTVWFAKNGTNIAATAGKITVPKSSDGGTALFACEIFEVLAANDYVEAYWYPEDTDVTLKYQAAVTANPGVTPAIPVIPPAIVVVERVA